MIYSIIDIETTGGRPGLDRITEIAIILHDGEKVIETFSTLVNPECSIPYSITDFTGISDDMVSNAPKFFEIAQRILSMTQNTTFVAHNVTFDYNFVKAAFKNIGVPYHTTKLCTVRLSRKAFPGLASYSLGNLCDSLGIRIENRHRALGDAKATAILFNKILAKNTSPLFA